MIQDTQQPSLWDQSKANEKPLPAAATENWEDDPGVSLLLSKGGGTLISIEDYELASQFKWYKSFKRIKRGVRYYITGHSRGTYVILHRFIMSAPHGMQVDHRNRNPLDNRRSNLRLCTAAQNSLNMSRHFDSLSKFKGVSFNKKLQKFHARAMVNGRDFHLGYHKTEREAAIAYNSFAIQHHGEFANLNSIP